MARALVNSRASSQASSLASEQARLLGRSSPGRIII